MPPSTDHSLPSRRDFLQTSAAALAAFPAGAIPFSFFPDIKNEAMDPLTNPEQSMIGQYGPWAAGLSDDPPRLSFRRPGSPALEAWRSEALEQVAACLGAPDIGQDPKVTVLKQYTYDGLAVEELSWQLPYGRPTQAILLKPAGAEGPLPGILGLHDHGGNKYFARRKITRTGDDQHPLMAEHQAQYYEGRAWANEVARRGYVVLVPDNFTFGSRRVHYEDAGGFAYGPLQTEGRSAVDPDSREDIEAYNEWAGHHEHIMAKSLFCGGTTWPGVFLREDQRALDVLCNRPEVDAARVGCCGLSGGGLRTAYLGGLDPRIRCAVAVGFMTTWRDLLLYKSYTHTWMTYIPILPSYLDFPEVYGLRVPRPTMVLNNRQDELFTLPEMERADAILRDVFAKAGAAERYRGSFYDGPHKFDREMQEEAFGWMDQWLKG